jgi:hypothetical protein
VKLVVMVTNPVAVTDEFEMVGVGTVVRIPPFGKAVTILPLLKVMNSAEST